MTLSPKQQKKAKNTASVRFDWSMIKFSAARVNEDTINHELTRSSDHLRVLGLLPLPVHAYTMCLRMNRISEATGE